MEAPALHGMSGGGVFNGSYAQVGVAVRASFAAIGVQYVRAVRMRYLVNLIARAYGELPTEQRADLRRYLAEALVESAGNAAAIHDARQSLAGRSERRSGRP